MIKKISVTNRSTGDSVDIKTDSNQFVLDYVDWGSPSVSMESYRVPFQIGESLSGVTVGGRAPTIYGHVISPVSGVSILGKTWEQYYQMQEEGINQNKLMLDKIFSVYQDVQIDVDGYHLIARPSTPVMYSTTEQENNEVVCRFMVSLYCFEPMFFQDRVTVDLASIEDEFHFPLIIPQNEGIMFGEVMRRQSVLIENAGDVPVGCTITIRASGGSVIDPRVYNVNTGDYIGFEGVQLSLGDYIIITTENGEENATKHVSGTSEDVSVIGNITEGSTFIQIEQGSMLYSYDVSEGQGNNAEILVEFVPKFFNVKGM